MKTKKYPITQRIFLKPADQCGPFWLTEDNGKLGWPAQLANFSPLSIERRRWSWENWGEKPEASHLAC